MAGPGNAWVTAGAVAGLLAAVGDLAVPFAVATGYPGYRHLRQAVSDLGAVGSPVAHWMNGWWVVFGVLVLGFAAAVAWTFRAAGPAAWVIAAQIACLGLFAGIGTALFPLDAAGPGVSLSTRLHNLCGGLGFLPVLFAPAASLLLFTPARAPVLFWVCVATQGIGLLIAAMFLGLDRALLPSARPSLFGLWQRAFLANLYVYLSALAASMLSADGGRWGQILISD